MNPELTTLSWPPSLIKDRAAAVARLGAVAGAGVGVNERHVLHDQLRPPLLLAVRGRVLLPRAAGVHVQDAVLAAAAQRDEPAPSRTTRRLVFTTVAVAVILIVTGLRVAC